MVSKKLVDQLIRHEGLGTITSRGRTNAYRCPAGRLTIGYGHNLDANPLTDEEKERTGFGGRSITLEGAKWLLERDIEKAEKEVLEHLPWAKNLNEARREALINMAFQMGIGGLLKFKNSLGAIEDGDYASAYAALMLSKWARQTPARAKEIALQIKSGVYAS